MLKELNIESYFGNPNAKLFNQEANIICNSISQFLQDEKLDTGHIECIDLIFTKKVIGNTIVNSGWKLRKQIIFDFELFWESSNEIRQKILVEISKQQVLAFAESFNWNIKKIIKAFDRAKESNYSTTKIYNKPLDFVESKKIYLGYTYEKDGAIVFLNFTKDNKLISQKKLCKVWPDKEYLLRLHGNFKKEEDKIIIESSGLSRKSFKLIYNLENDKTTLDGDIPRWIELI
ncbi:hypothetical protein [Mangrovivirga cuniculi]|uniref:Uncharacterized protein n=1 Tax=Mangrovivirga cuniculi TaxID=2715131 RepID=A0A4D7K2Z7_9BACT|nr:hypothetical protein [Mangrovivirga cuniculi]QCK13778.1 hypothetical protein DCC35_02895 [Mangrovivirga cuniculi]